MYFDNTSVEKYCGAEFGPFGEPLYERGVVSNYIPFRLYGMYKDMETGLYYNVRRYYDWRIGRYLQPDPVSDLNLYVYANNSPYDAVDPVGMFETAIKIKAKVYLGPIVYVYRHSGAPKHEEITEEAIKALGYPKLSQYGFRIDDWEGGLQFQVGIATLQCRKEANRVSQGVNIADCLFKDNSSYHCDNSNID
jgi:RHS repeat-associated protein